MGLITKKVLVVVNKSTEKYYENKGYYIPKEKNKHGILSIKRWTKIEVSVFDLPNKSGIGVDVSCSKCGKVGHLEWRNYKKKEEGYVCFECFSREDSFKKYGKTRLQQGMSFYDWCHNNDRLDILKRYDKELNKEDPKNINKGSAKKYYFKCPNNIHESRLMGISKITNGTRTGNIECVECLSIGYICPDSLKFFADKNKDILFTIKSKSKIQLFWICENNIHKNFERSVENSYRRNFRCPLCMLERTESMLEEKVRKHLNSLPYEILHEKNCSLNPKNPIKHKTMNSKVLRYDNEIIISDRCKIFCEVNGSQHYSLSLFHKKQADLNGTTPEYEFWYQQEKDKYKKQYVLDHGYTFLELSYKTDDKKETWKKLINKAINKELKKMKP